MPEATEMKHFLGQGGRGRGSVRRGIRCLLNSSLNFLQMAGYATGLMRLVASPSRANGAIILMYHSVADELQSQWIDPANHVPAHVFARQMEFLSKRRRVVSLEELAALIHQVRTPASGTIAITFDDGYLDNLTTAAPILDSYGLPATLFLPTGYIDRGETQWIDQVYGAFKFRTGKQLTWGEKDTVTYRLDETSQRQESYRAVCRSLLSSDPDQRRIRLHELTEQLRPSASPPRLTMTWDEVRTLVAQYPSFAIGSHTLEHVDLTCMSEEKVQQELIASSQRIEQKIDFRPKFFSFCYGRTTEPLRIMVAQAGYAAACGGGGLDPVIRAPADLFRLPRVAAPGHMDNFDLITSSVNTGIWRKLGR